MEEKTKDIAIVSLEEWGEFVNQLLEEQTNMMANLLLSVSDPLTAEVLCNVGSLVFSKTVNVIGKKLFPDAKLTKNEKGELKWK